MSDLVLQLKQINKYFGRSHVIKDVNIDFEKGHFVTFLGPSGCHGISGICPLSAYERFR